MTEEPHERLQRARLAAGFQKAADAARRFGWPEPTYFAHENGSRDIRRAVAEKYAKAFKVGAAWITHGEGPGPAASLEGGAVVTPKAIGALTPAPEMVTVHGQEFRAIAVYDIRAAAGAGAENHDEEPISWSMFRAEWLRRVTRSPELLSVLRITGDSMHPTLHDGDTVLVDRGVRTIGRDGIYILRLGDDVQCKRCSRHPSTGVLTIASDNAAYPSYTDIRPDGIQVIGRVIWTGRGV